MATVERRILEALPNTVFAVDLDGRITSVNRPRAQRAMGGAALDHAGELAVPGASITEALAHAGGGRIERAMAALRTGRAKYVAWEFSRSTADGDTSSLLQAAALTDQASVTGFCFSIVDITPAHRSRQALAEAGVALARHRTLDRVCQEVAQQARRIISAEGLVIALADEVTAALRIAFQSGTANDAATAEDRLRATWLEALGAGGIVSGDSPTGTTLTIALSSGEGPLGVMTVDVERLDSPEREAVVQGLLSGLALHAGVAIERAWMARREEQQQRIEAIGEVAAGVAHELRNPLFGISSAAQLLRFRAKDDPVIEKNIGRILREVERLNRMTSSLLEYGRPHPLRLAPGDPDAVWDRVLEAERGRLETSALSLVRTRAHRPAHCAVDIEQLSQAFTGILANAIEAAPEATDIALTTEVLATGAWRCRLQNGGPVIAPENVSRVFEIFYSTKPGAAGFGLPLCQRIVEDHGGTLSLESTPDTGTTVTVILPPAA